MFISLTFSPTRSAYKRFQGFENGKPWNKRLQEKKEQSDTRKQGKDQYGRRAAK